MTTSCADIEARFARQGHERQGHERSGHEQSLTPRPAADATSPVELAGLHNVVAYTEDMLSGGVPVGPEGLATLAAMGIKTVVSVDGATPDVTTAEALGLRYIHLPISYDAVPAERRQQLAQVLTNCERPVYMHCHHGKHRSAAALGTAAVTAGVLSRDQARARMVVSGTSKNYPGLWQSLRDAVALPPARLEVDPATFPKVAKVTGLVATMSELDIVFDNIKDANKAEWAPSEDHPDLVARNETTRLRDLFAQLVDEPESQKLPAPYQDQLKQAIADAEALDAAVAGNDVELANELFARVKKSCKSCHVDYRDR